MNKIFRKRIFFCDKSDKFYYRRRAFFSTVISSPPPPDCSDTGEYLCPFSTVMESHLHSPNQIQSSADDNHTSSGESQDYFAMIQAHHGETQPIAAGPPMGDSTPHRTRESTL